MIPDEINAISEVHKEFGANRHGFYLSKIKFVFWTSKRLERHFRL